MQSAAWYYRRLESMSWREIGWRLGRATRTVCDRFLLARRQGITGRQVLADRTDLRTMPVLKLAVADHVSAPAEIEAATAALVHRADHIVSHQVDLFDLQALNLGPRINWNFEYKARRQAPLVFAPDVDYRDYRQVGDCKFLWELNRHQHWVTLGSAYRLTGDNKYAAALVAEFDSWIEQCPYGLGMNWRSPLEMAIRVINWAWAFALIRPSGLISPERQEQIARSVYLHLWDISRNYSRFSSANNHLIGEAAGVFIAASAFDGLRGAATWRKRSRDILIEQIEQQTHPDGGNKEQASGYHLFVLEFFLLAEWVARQTGEEFPPAYRARLERMLEYLAGWLEGGPLPQYGDADDGYVLDLGGTRESYAQELLAVGAVLFDRPDWARLAEAGKQRVWWLLGQTGLDVFAKLAARSAESPLRSRAFRETGHYLLAATNSQSGDRISLSMDCGELGFGEIAAHGHADALSVTLRVNGIDVLIDPGTYDYFTYRAWRDYFKSTRAHNTVVVDGLDQSEMLGLFLWGRRAQAWCTRWEPDDQGGIVSGEHDGYQSLARPVNHRRTVSLAGDRGEITIVDELSGEGAHTAAIHLHFGPDCELCESDTGSYCARFPGGAFSIQFDRVMRCRLVKGCECPIEGWASRAYHMKVPTWTIVAEAKWEGSIRLESRLQTLRVPALSLADVAGESQPRTTLVG